MFWKFLLSGDSFIHHYVDEPKPFLNNVPNDNHAKIVGHAAWYREDDYETVSVFKLKTTHFPLAAWILARAFLVFQTCAQSACTSTARSMAHG